MAGSGIFWYFKNKSKLDHFDTQLAEIATEIDTLVTSVGNYYLKCLSTDYGALLVVASGATTGQINIASVSPRMDTYTPVAGDYVTKVSNLLTAELVLARISAIKNKTFGSLDDRLEELDADTYFPMTNKVVNGDFSNGTIGWGTVGLLSFTVSNNEATCLADSQNDYASQNIAVVNGNKYYASVDLKSTSNQARLTLGATTKYHGGSGNYERLSVLWTSDRTSVAMALTDARTSAWDNYYIKNAIMIDLTSLFGVGNEPSQAQMDSIMSFYLNSWFSGTVNLAKNSRLMPYLLNNIRQLNLEKTSYGVYSGLTVIAQATPDMTVNVATGVIYMANGRRFAPVANTALVVTTADATNPRIDIVYVDFMGTIRYLAGTAGASPSAPSVPTDGQKLYEINVTAGATAITNAMLVDKRRLNWQEAWITPTLVNGWVADTSYPVYYMKDSLGFVHLKGRLKSGSLSTLAISLPAGYRSSQLLTFPISSNGAFGSIQVNSSGVVPIVGQTTHIQLDGVTFRADI